MGKAHRLPERGQLTSKSWKEECQLRWCSSRALLHCHELNTCGSTWSLTATDAFKGYLRQSGVCSTSGAAQDVQFKSKLANGVLVSRLSKHMVLFTMFPEQINIQVGEVQMSLWYNHYPGSCTHRIYVVVISHKQMNISSTGKLKIPRLSLKLPCLCRGNTHSLPKRPHNMPSK